MDLSTITTIIALLSGVALFLYGMAVMGDGLKQVAGNKLELILYKLTNTPLKGLLLGAGVTAIIQSSSATSVMVVGFVNSGMMKVMQGIGIIMGANIGTSITGWIICLSYLDGQQGIAQLLSTATISGIVAIAGIVLRMFSKKEVLKSLGNIMLGFAVLMVGMQMMSAAVAPLKDSPIFINTLSTLTNPVLGILFGIAVTAVLQSASAAVGVLQALSVTGAIVFRSAFPMIMGIGIGASVPVLLSAIGTNKNGKRTALVYLLNDLFAMIIGSVGFYGLNFFMHFDFLNTVMNPFSIAALNTVYRLIAMIILLPFVKGIDKLVHILIPESEDDEEEKDDFGLLEERFLAYPALAINQTQITMNNMAIIVMKNLGRAYDLFDHFDEKKYQKIKSKEERIDKYEDKIGTYLLSLTGKELSAEQSRSVSEFLHCVGDFERIGDHAYEIAKVAKDLHTKKLSFSPEAKQELKVLRDATTEIIDLTVESFENYDTKKAVHVEPLRGLIGMLCDELKLRHISRLRAGSCSLEQGMAFSELLNNLERIADHCSNIAICLLELDENNTYDAHKYEENYRNKKQGEYTKYFDEYDMKYEI